MASSEKIAHLGFIQGVINRMGSNAFLIKGWTIALVAAIFALSSKDSNSSFLFIGLLPILVFWIFDAYYLRQEKLYRKLYEDVAADVISSDRFSMSTKYANSEIKPVLLIAITRSVFPFYSLIVAVILIFAAKPGIFLSSASVAANEVQKQSEAIRVCGKKN